MTHRSIDPFGARSELQTLSGPVTIYRLARLAELGLVRPGAAALFDPCLAGRPPAAVQRPGDHRGTCREPGPLGRPLAGRGRTALQTGPRRPAGLYRRAGRGRSGRPALGDAPPGRRSRPHQSPGAGRPGHRPLGPGRRLWQQCCACLTTPSASSSATGSATSSSTGPRTPLTISASCRRPPASSTR